jgi:hypothetical protein
MSSNQSNPEQNREMFAQFGLAMYHVQCVERSLAILSAFLSARGRQIGNWQIDYEMDERFLSTMGRLIEEVQSIPESLPDSLREKLPLALQRRNMLVHDYWWEHASFPLSEAGRLHAIRELSALCTFFEDFDAEIVVQYEKIAQERGFDWTRAAEEMRQLRQEPPQTVQKARVLRAKETIVSAQKYRFTDNPKKYIPVFSLDDGTLWTFGDRGLVPIPLELPVSAKEKMTQLEELLPAELNPRPRAAGSWDYILYLSTGAQLRVSPGKSIGGPTYSWSLKIPLQ